MVFRVFSIWEQLLVPDWWETLELEWHRAVLEGTIAKFIQCREHSRPHPEPFPFQHTMELSGFREWQIVPAHFCFTLTGQVVLGKSLLPIKWRKAIIGEWRGQSSGDTGETTLHLSCPLLGSLWVYWITCSPEELKMFRKWCQGQGRHEHWLLWSQLDQPLWWNQEKMETGNWVAETSLDNMGRTGHCAGRL